MFEILNFLLTRLDFRSYFIKLIHILGQVSLHNVAYLVLHLCYRILLHLRCALCLLKLWLESRLKIERVTLDKMVYKSEVKDSLRCKLKFVYDSLIGLCIWFGCYEELIPKMQSQACFSLHSHANFLLLFFIFLFIDSKVIIFYLGIKVRS